MRRQARYDGLADWYDAEFYPAPLEGRAWEAVVRLLGNATGELLDVGCGTGTFASGLAELGWSVTGVDFSEDMLRRARARGVDAVRADAAQLPFPDDSFDAATSVLTHTDIDDFASAAREIARVLRPPGTFVYVGVHPCFVGPHSRFEGATGAPELHEGWYRHVGRYDEAPGIVGTGVRSKIGATHLPLETFVQTFLAAGFTLERFEEIGEFDYPHMVALRWTT
jgi:ubiquinone/menaquinone biosynthesis C-methylase UbiE